MHRYRPHGSRSSLRRILLLACLAAFLSVTFLPLDSTTTRIIVREQKHHISPLVASEGVQSDQQTVVQPGQNTEKQQQKQQQQPAQPGGESPPVFHLPKSELAPAKDQQQQQQQQQGQHSGADDEIDEIQLPQTEEDYERILRLPHYDECNLCKVCVPYDVVKHHPKAKAHHFHRDRRLVDTHDPDVTLEDNRPAQENNGNSNTLRRLKSSGNGAHSRNMGDMGSVHGRHVSSRKHAGAMHGSHAHSDGATWHGGANRSMAVPRWRRGRSLHNDENKEETESDGLYYVRGKVIDLRSIAPGDTKAGPRRSLPNCTACWGCRHTLEMMAMGTVMAGSYYAHEPGGSPSWLFRVRTNRTRSGWAVVKLWCVPVRKAKQRGLAMCSPPKVYAQVKLLLAQNKLIRQCGLDSVVPSLWVEPVMGVIPGHGFRIDWLGLWAEIADGTSVQNIQEFGKPKTNPQYMLDLFTKNVNHTDLKTIAIFDVLFSQCDRHQQNIFITEQGKVWAIDNDQVYAVAWRKCGFDSMILPTTQKFMINHLGFFYVLKYPHKNPPTTWTKLLNPLLLLDYRCHVEGGAIGFSYPPKLKQCLQHVSTLSAVDIQEEYGYPHIRMADAVRNRTTDLLQRGFEWTLLYGEPTNQPMHRYKVAPSCCSMTYDNVTKKYSCDTPYHQVTDIPYGNPWHGGPWHGAEGKDSGSYVGGTAF